MPNYDLAGYVRHAEMFGPECVLETAASDLTRSELGELKAFIDSKLRTCRWINGRWEPRRERAPRQCEQCGLDLPSGARAHARFHPHCRGKAWRERQERRGTVLASRATDDPTSGAEPSHEDGYEGATRPTTRA